jgi:hypothetical protein
VAVAQFVELEAELELVLPPAAALLLELLELLLQPAASRILPTAAVTATIVLVARKVSLPCRPQGVGGELVILARQAPIVAKNVERKVAGQWPAAVRLIAIYALPAVFTGYPGPWWFIP